ncbi:MAG: hypothetical protein ACREOW_15720 [Thermodesulfobacteriota bacterium]
MTITIAHFTVDSSCDCKPPPLGHEKEEHINGTICQLVTGESISTTNTYLLCIEQRTGREDKTTMDGEMAK